MRHTWRLAAVGAATLWLGAGTVHAQNLATGYVFGAPGQFRVSGFSNRTFQAGGGVEYILASGLGAGAELGYLAPTASWSDGLGVFSANVSYHIRLAASRVVPFVTGGYSLMFREGHLNAFNVGGGVNYWFGRRAGLRLELRDHLHSESDVTGHWWGARIGLSLR